MNERRLRYVMQGACCRICDNQRTCNSGAMFDAQANQNVGHGLAVLSEVRGLWFAVLFGPM